MVAPARCCSAIVRGDFDSYAAILSHPGLSANRSSCAKLDTDGSNGNARRDDRHPSNRGGRGVVVDEVFTITPRLIDSVYANAKEGQDGSV